MPKYKNGYIKYQERHQHREQSKLSFMKKRELQQQQMANLFSNSGGIDSSVMEEFKEAHENVSNSFDFATKTSGLRVFRNSVTGSMARSQKLLDRSQTSNVKLREQNNRVSIDENVLGNSKKSFTYIQKEIAQQKT